MCHGLGRSGSHRSKEKYGGDVILFEKVQIIVFNLCDHLGGERIFKFRSVITYEVDGYRRVNEVCIEY